MVLASTAIGVAVAVAPARAADVACNVGGGENTNMGPEHAAVGTTAWVPQLDDAPIPDGKQGAAINDYTLWEVAGPRGLDWSYARQLRKPLSDYPKVDRNDPEDALVTNCSPVDATLAPLSQMMFEATRFMGGLTIGLKQLATTVAPFKPFYAEQRGLVDLLTKNLFLPAMALGVIVTGAWVLTRTRRHDDARETYRGVIGAAAITVALVAVLSAGNYQTLTNAIDRYTSEFDSGLLNVLAGSVAGENVKTDPCYLVDGGTGSGLTTAPSAGNKEPRGGGSPGDAQRGHRVSSCMLYKMLLFNPWMNGQFGSASPMLVNNLCYMHGDRDDQADPVLGKVKCTPDESAQNDDICQFSPYRCQKSDRPKGTKINLAVQQVIAQAYTHDEATGKAKPRQSYNALWKGVEYAVADKYPNQFPHWKGAEPSSRMATALASGIMNLIVLVIVGAIAILTLFWHGVMFVAWILLPVAAAVAIVPPGRRIIRSVLGILVQAVFLRCVLGLVLVILLAIMNAIQIANSDTALKIILMLIAAAALWKVMGALRSGALGPGVVGTAAETGMLPADQAATSAGAAGVRRAGVVTAAGVRHVRGRAAGAMAGMRTARQMSTAPAGSAERRREVLTGGVRGIRTGGRAQTEAGRRRMEIDRDTRESAQFAAKAAEARRLREQELRERLESQRPKVNPRTENDAPNETVPPP